MNVPTTAEHLYKAYANQIHSYAYRLLGNWEDAEDLTQQVFVKALATEKDDHSHPRAWLHTIAHNLAMDIFKHRRIIAWHSLEALSEKHTIAADGDDFAMVEELDRIVRAAGMLSDQDKCLIQIYLVEDKSVLETAALTGHRLGGVKMAISRARRRLSTALEAQS